jgi:hypothetical protein
MKLPSATTQYHAVSMEFAAYLDARNVEMRILTSTGETVGIVCPRDSIFAIQKHIELMGKACPEIATWRRLDHADREPLSVAFAVAMQGAAATTSAHRPL